MQDKHCYEDSYLAQLKTTLQHSHYRLKGVDDRTKITELTLISSGFMLLAAVLFMSQGYHAGFHAINNLSHLLPESFLQILTFLGDTLVCLALLLPFVRRNPAILVIALITAVYGTLVCKGMKLWFDMPRPPAMLNPSDFFLTGKALTRHSFPSGHSLTIFSLLTLFYYFSSHRSTKVILMLFGSSVALSRVLVGAHWPLDVLIGSTLGILISVVAIHSAKHWHKGFSVAIHFVALAIVIAGVVLLFSHNGGYPKNTVFAFVIATFSLAHFIWDYVMFYFFAESLPQGLKSE